MFLYGLWIVWLEYNISSSHSYTFRFKSHYITKIAFNEVNIKYNIGGISWVIYIQEKEVIYMPKKDKAT